MENSSSSFYEPIKSLFIFIVIIWSVHFISFVFPLQQYGLVPRDLQGGLGIITAPFLHGSFSHLALNTVGLLIFGIIFSLLENKRTFVILIKIALIQGILTWLFAGGGTHIGASGIIFGLYGYLMLVGFFQKKFKYIVISIFILFSYGGMIFGVLPGQPFVSWEGHLFGFIAGGIAAKFQS
ncbi:MAG: rhomboid family intramembrane serine protease [Candidatus Marinimicrobia bacterium]|nr:rhomboid family intramembrane serine protease [Candidatus Neomarinimicrobiota bacterium]